MKKSKIMKMLRKQYRANLINFDEYVKSLEKVFSVNKIIYICKDCGLFYNYSVYIKDVKKKCNCGSKNLEKVVLCQAK